MTKSATLFPLAHSSIIGSMDLKKEKEIIRRAKKNPEVFGVIFDEYYKPIFGYIIKRVGNVEISQDITSETFLKALDRLWQFQWRNISISSWLYRIATNEINQHFRKSNRYPRSLEELIKNGFDPSSEIDLFEEMIEQEKKLTRAKEWGRLSKEIRALPEKYQTVIALRYFEEKKIAEIAEILGKKEGTIKSLLSRALKKLRERNQNNREAF